MFFERDDLGCSAPRGELSQIKKADLNEERGLVPVDVLVRESSAPPWSIPPKVLEPIGCHVGVPDRVLNVLVPEVVLQGSRIVAIVGELEPTGMAKHVRVDREARQPAPKSLPGNDYACYSAGPFPIALN